MKLQQNEWRLLAETPVAVFSLIAAADGSVDETERLALLTTWVPRLVKLRLSSDPREHEVYRYILQERCIEAAEKGCLMTHQEARKCLQKTGRILADKLTPPEASFLRHALMTLARDVAKAAAAYFGLGAAITAEEQVAINTLGHLLTTNEQTTA